MSIWTKLDRRYSDTGNRPISSLFDADADRFAGFSVLFEDMLLDFSKTNIDADTLSDLLELAREQSVAGRRDAMFSGERINQTEVRAVLHTVLRNIGGGPVFLDGVDVMPGVECTYRRMSGFAEDIRSGKIRAANGEMFSDVVNIGIGGSDLGPVMSSLALSPYHDGPAVHFVSNVDGADISDTLAGLDPARTLVIVASKTFTTIETMTNAKSARDWFAAALGAADVVSHLAAVSSNLEKTAEFGIDPERVFGFEDWVGGRYSVWGPVGLSLMLGIGPVEFDRFLAGARAMDRHFQTAPLAENMPVLLALVGIWHGTICGYGTRAVLPYDQRLSRLPAYLQQLDMESNGKSVRLDGLPVSRTTGPIVWGEPGTNGQHAFYQLLHQGSQVVPCEFLLAVQGHEKNLKHQHDLLVANCLAQSEALMVGRSPQSAREKLGAKGFSGPELDRQAHHRVFPGNRPSTTLIYDRLDPYTLGKIIALYEHRVFVEGVIWGINSFDQWGVELGKELAVQLLPAVSGDVNTNIPQGSTSGLLAFLKTRSGA